jgi:hypothetical protein
MKKCIAVSVLLATWSFSYNANAMDVTEMIAQSVKAVAGMKSKLTVGGDATTDVSIQGVGGVVNVGVDAGGSGGIIKQAVAGIYTGSIGGSAKTNVSIQGAGGVVNVGVGAAGGIIDSEQTIGTIGDPGL